MAINVYLTIFLKYNANRLKNLEWAYLLLCYGVTFIIALVCLFVSTPSRGKIYGPNILWCSIDIQWVFMRMAIVYIPAWVCIAASLIIYTISGIEIFKKRAQLIAFKPARYRENVTTSSSGDEPKITQIRISDESANPDALSPSEGSCVTTVTAEAKAIDLMPLTNHKSPRHVMTTVRPSISRSSSSAEFNTAALGYTKVAILFFCSLLITWVPPSINRFYSFLHPHQIHVPSAYATSFVLPMMGFWNSAIYIVTSWTAVRRLFTFRKVNVRRTNDVMSMR